jgi:hypothetical protein
MSSLLSSSSLPPVPASMGSRSGTLASSSLPLPSASPSVALLDSSSSALPSPSLSSSLLASPASPSFSSRSCFLLFLLFFSFFSFFRFLWPGDRDRARPSAFSPSRLSPSVGVRDRRRDGGGDRRGGDRRAKRLSPRPRGGLLPRGGGGPLLS